MCHRYNVQILFLFIFILFSNLFFSSVHAMRYNRINSLGRLLGIYFFLNAFQYLNHFGVQAYSCKQNTVYITQINRITKAKRKERSFCERQTDNGNKYIDNSNGVWALAIKWELCRWLSATQFSQCEKNEKSDPSKKKI